MAATESPPVSLKALTAFLLEHFACSTTLSISAEFKPSSFIGPDSSSSLTSETIFSTGLSNGLSPRSTGLSPDLYLSAAAYPKPAPGKSCNLTSPKTTYVLSAPGLFKISGSSI